MKKFLFVLSVLFVCICAKADNVKFVVTGIAPKNITELEVRNLNSDDIGGTLIDKVKVKDGHFTYKGNLPDNTFLKFWHRQSGMWNVIITDGENITLDMMQDKAWGSPLTEKLFVEAHKIGAKGDGTEPARLKQIDKAVEENKDNCLPAYFIGFNLDNLSYEKLVEFEQSGDAYTKCPMFQMTRAHIAKERALRALVGTKYKDITAKSGNGQSHNLSEYVGKKNYTLVTFWNSRYSVNYDEIPVFEECYNKYKSQGLEVVSVALEQSRAEWINGVSNFNMSWTQLYEEGNGRKKLFEDLKKKYGMSKLPMNFLCDKDGTIIAINMKPQQLKDKLSEVFGN